MKQILLSLALTVVTATTVLADSYNYLTIATSSSEASVALRQLKKITFVGDDMIVTTVDGNENSFALADLNSMYFASTATAISRTESARTLAYENGQLIASGSGIIQVFNAAGSLVRSLSASSSRTSVNLSALPRGIYIVKQGNNTIKIAK
ncbi:MAG: T9SS type A sorting domain-containing protein [Bacteroidaceae bacterium]|nr:T9SS type A sorting domain-containing protein [Bacteroidaceae bacterium]